MPSLKKELKSLINIAIFLKKEKGIMYHILIMNFMRMC